MRSERELGSDAVARLSAGALARALENTALDILFYVADSGGFHPFFFFFTYTLSSSLLCHLTFLSSCDDLYICRFYALSLAESANSVSGQRLGVP